jgi:hypothetical protein
MRVKTIKESWESYLREVIPASAPEIQKRECRHVWYGACAAMFAILSDISDLPEAEAVEEIEKRHQEMRDYVAEYAKEHGVENPLEIR